MSPVRTYPSLALWMMLISLIFGACSHRPAPKPRGYYRITFPTDTQRISLSIKDWPYTFTYAGFSKVEIPFSQAAEKFWCNLEYGSLNATLFLSYKPLSKVAGQSLAYRIEESYQLSYKHVVKADYIRETPFAFSEKKVYGCLYEIGGDAASCVQFYATDSSRHFLRGALYFNCTPQRDSLAPAIDFLTLDIQKLLQSIQWEKP